MKIRLKIFQYLIIQLATLIFFCVGVIYSQPTSNNSSNQLLKPGQSIDREMNGAEIHRYIISLRKDEFLQVRVEQKGVDVILKLLNANDTILATMDSPNDDKGTETLSFVAVSAGSYVFQVSGIDDSARKGNYSIKREVSRTATTEDRRRVALEKIFVEGVTARNAGQRETAVAKWEEALKGWEELKDAYLARLTAEQIKLLKETAESPQHDVRPLQMQENIERQMKSGDTHFYTTELKKDQVLRIDARENGIDLKAGLFRVADKQFMVISDFGFGNDRETFTYIVEQAGSYAVLMSASGKLNGTYQMTANVNEKAEAQDIARIRAAALLTEGLTSRNKRTLEGFRAAIEKWESALLLWQTAGEKYWEGFTANFLGFVHDFLGEKQKALDFYNQALPLARSVEDKSGEAISLNNIGLVYSDLGEKQKALDYYNQALPLFRLLNDKRNEAGVLANIGGIYEYQGENTLALEFLNQSLLIDRAVGTKGGEATTLTGIGKIYSNIGEKQKALDYFNQALPLRRLAGDKSGEATTLSNIGALYSDLGEKLNALKFYEQALQLRRVSGDKNGEAVTLLGMGAIFDDQGDPPKALEYYNQALPLFRATSDKNGEAVTLNNIGAVYDDLGDNPKELAYYNQALSLYHTVGNKGGEAVTLLNIGKFYSDVGEKLKAFEYLNQALPIARGRGDKRLEAKMVSNIGAVYSALNEKQKALEYYEQALQLRQAVGDRSGEAVTLSNIGAVYSDLGENKKAIKLLNQALPLFRATSDKSGEAITLSNIGAVYSDLGENRQAVRFYDDALKLFNEVGQKNSQATTLNNLGKSHMELQEKDEALKFFNEALPLYRQVSDKAGEAITLSNLGKLYSDAGENQKALDCYNQSLLLSRAIGDKKNEAATLNNLGEFYSDLNEKEKALKFHNEALLLRQQVGDKAGEFVTLNNLMFIWESLNNRSFAVFYGKQSVNKFQELRGLAQGGEIDSETQKSFLRRFQGAYEKLAELLVFENQFEQAVRVLSLYQDQQFFDFNFGINLEVQKLKLSPYQQGFADLYTSEGNKVRQISSQLAELKLQFGTRPPNEQESAQLEMLTTELKSASEEFSKLLNDASNQFSKRSGELDKVPADNINDILKAVADFNTSLKQNVVTIYTLIGEKQFHLFLISKDGIKHFSTPVKGIDLNEKAKEFSENIRVIDIRSRKPKFNVIDQAKELYDIVFKPIENELPKGATTIMWNLDGNLRYVPINALHDGTDYLVRRNLSNVVFTRFDAKLITRSLNATWKATGFVTTKEKKQVLNLDVRYDFPPLVAGEYEMNSIIRKGNSKSGILKGDILLNTEFTRETMLIALRKQNPVVHISSHFKIQPGDLARSFLVLGDGTAFSLFEMREEAQKSFSDRKLFAGVDLLTLSACDTGMSEPDSDGREVDSFAELAQRFGAASVMATLWSVNECSTAEFMRLFYENKINNSMNKAQAIRQAQLALLDGIVKSSAGCRRKSEDARKDEPVAPKSTKNYPAYKENPTKPFAHPYYWSPFILYGNWQ